jgi:cyclopropane fatty-acyl-phospholipid synthase-like methyltransferase
MQISEDYAKQLQMMHSGQGDKIGFGVEPAAKLVEVIKAYPIVTALDFGCGEGNMMARLTEMFSHLQIQGYDPGVERFSTLPEKVDLIYSADVLEHIEPHLLDDTLKNLWNIGRYQYHNIACHPAKKTLPDGRNCHLIVEEPDWWLEKIKSTIDPNSKITYTNVYHTFKKKRKGTHLEVVIVR